MLRASPSPFDPVRLRDLVRTSRGAIGLVALRSQTFLELSPTAVSVTGLRPDDRSVDLATMTSDATSVSQMLSLMADGVLDACRIWTTVPAALRGAAGVPRDEHGVLVSIRAVARDADEVYALALFGSRSTETGSMPDACPVGMPTMEHLLGPLFQLADPAWPIEQHLTFADRARYPGLDELTARQQEILHRLLCGDRVPTISRGMHLAASTVRNHLMTIYRKVGVHSQAELLERLRGVEPELDGLTVSRDASSMQSTGRMTIEGVLGSEARTLRAV